MFTKIQRALVKHWRSRGFRIFTYLDDGAGGEQGFAEACSISESVRLSVRKDVRSSGFVANEEKSMWMPSQYVELLGFIVDLKAGTFQVPPRRVDALKQLLDIIIAKVFSCIRTDFRDFKIRDATASRTRWLIMDWDKNAVVCAGKVKLRSPTRSKKTRLRNALYQFDSSAFLSQK